MNSSYGIDTAHSPNRRPPFGPLQPGHSEPALFGTSGGAPESHQIGSSPETHPEHYQSWLGPGTPGDSVPTVAQRDGGSTAEFRQGTMPSEALTAIERPL